MRLLPVLVIGFVLMGSGVLWGAGGRGRGQMTRVFPDHLFPVPKSDYQTVKTTHKFSVPEKSWK